MRASTQGNDSALRSALANTFALESRDRLCERNTVRNSGTPLATCLVIYIPYGATKPGHASAWRVTLHAQRPRRPVCLGASRG